MTKIFNVGDIVVPEDRSPYTEDCNGRVIAVDDSHESAWVRWFDEDCYEDVIEQFSDIRRADVQVTISMETAMYLANRTDTGNLIMGALQKSVIDALGEMGVINWGTP